MRNENLKSIKWQLSTKKEKHSEYLLKLNEKIKICYFNNFKSNSKWKYKHIQEMRKQRSTCFSCFFTKNKEKKEKKRKSKVLRDSYEVK